jgi:hypothetical protein
MHGTLALSVTLGRAHMGAGRFVPFLLPLPIHYYFCCPRLLGICPLLHHVQKRHGKPHGTAGCPAGKCVLHEELNNQT